MSTYRQEHTRSLEDPTGFWGEQGALIDWIHEPTQVLDDSAAPFYRWFADGSLNTCYNALDRHVAAGRGQQAALIYDSPVSDTQQSWTYTELLDRVADFAGGLAGRGVQKGDRVLIYMPMIPEAVVAMLACARLGAVHSVVFGGFAANELALRVDDARPRAILTASCGVERSRILAYLPIVERALTLAAHVPDLVVVKQRAEGPAELKGQRDVDWDLVAKEGSAQPSPCVEVAATDPLYVLYTSGTTGAPKGIVRDNGGHAVALAWSMRNVFDVGAGDVWWTASDVGWVVGHSFIVYGPLIAGATTILFEGKPVGTPDAGVFWRVVQEHRPKALFTAPTAIRAIKREDPEGRILARYDTSSLDALFLAGERLDPETHSWASFMLDVDVIDNWWQTETGWPIAANLRGLDPMPIKPGSPTVPVPGYDVQVLDESGKPVPAGHEGAICLRLPMPPGTLPTLWGDDERFRASYLSTYPGYYVSGDGGYLDEDGYLFVMGRTDDVINVAGHRLSTGAMEAVLAQHPDVAECAVIGAADVLKGQLPRGFVVLKATSGADPREIERQLVAMVRDQIGAVAAFKEVTVVSGLPKTRSGKVLRKTMRQIADGMDPAVPPTIEDESVLDVVRAAINAPTKP
jgi:propionyl-CoA synthetase